MVEGALALALMGAGVRHPLALAAVLVYRFVSFWMVISVGWVTYLFRGRAETANRPELAPSHRLGNVDLHLPVVVADV